MVVRNSPAPQNSALYVPVWMLAAVTGAFGLIALILLGIAFATRTADLPQPTAPAQVVTVAAPAPLPTPTIFVPPTPTVALIEPTATLPVAPSAGLIKVGDLVQVTGTGDGGILNLRAEAGLGRPVNYVALEREVLQVQGGPVEQDGIVWWYLVDPASSTRFGWGAQNYLQVVTGQ